MAKANVYKVAELAGVSIATVSRALNQPHRVTDATRAKVMEAVEKLQYVPDFEASVRARAHGERIAVIAPINTYPAFNLRLRGISLALSEVDAELIIFQIDPAKLNSPQHRKYIDSLASSGKYDGIIIMSLNIENQDLNRIATTRFPLVLIETLDPRFPSVHADHGAGAILATQHLIDRGYKKIAYIGYHLVHGYPLNAPKMREEAFIATMEKNKLAISDSSIYYTDHDIDATKELVKSILSKKRRPEAFFCASDFNALGTIKAAKELNLRVPEDIAVVGFDDIDMANYMDLTTIRQPLEGSGREAVKLITQIIKDPKALGPKTILLDLDLILRKSS